MRIAERIMIPISLALVVPALAQVVSPPSTPSDSGPSLQETLNFIVAKLTENPEVNYVEHDHDPGAGGIVRHGLLGRNVSFNFSIETTNLKADVSSDRSSCMMRFHQMTRSEKKVLHQVDAEVDLKSVRDVLVRSMEQEAKEQAVAAHSEVTVRIDPPVFVLRVQSKWTNAFYFYDETLANRVAKALRHAVELCGGVQEKEPF